MTTKQVLGFMHGRSGEVLLIKKARPAWQAGLWNAPGGHVEGNETAYEAVSREIYEETGHRIQPVLWAHFATLRLAGAEIVCLSTTTNLKVYEANCFSDEIAQVFPLARLPESVDCVPHLRWLFALSTETAIAKPALITLTAECI